MIDLEGKDDKDRISLREIIIRARSSNPSLSPNPTSLSFVEPRLKLRDKDIEDRSSQ